MKLSFHLFKGELASLYGFFAAFDDEFEALVKLVFNLFAVLKILVWALLKKLALLLVICSGNREPKSIRTCPPTYI